MRVSAVAGLAPHELRVPLNSGVPATEVARRAGHGVAVLLKICARCTDGQADAANQRIADALGGSSFPKNQGDDSEIGEQAS